MNYFKENQALWDAKTPHHVASDFYDMANFRAGNTSLKKIELEGMSDIDFRGKKVLHLQCHFGQDSLSLARMGAKVTGMDFSSVAILQACDLNREMGLDATFIQCNIYDLPQHLDEQFDVVFTSYGVLGWLPDMTAWAKIVRQYLKPNGIFYIAEFHPFIYLFDFDKVTIEYPYFNTGTPFMDEADGSYADSKADVKGKEYFWQHSLSEITQALLDTGLNLLDFKEIDYAPYNCFPKMKERAKGEYLFGDFGFSMPHIFTLKMRG